jgi:hypothetical protein
MKNTIRIILSLFIILITIISYKSYQIFQSSYESNISTNQVNDSVIQYSFIHSIIQEDLITNTLIFLPFLLLFILWIKPVVKELKVMSKENKNE